MYFYPKDDTPGCTKQACTIRDNFAEFKNLDVVVVGVSTDSVKSHKSFAEKYNLPFTLLADENKEVVEIYSVRGRTSFLINPKGKIEKIYENVKPIEHGKEVLSDLKRIKR